MNDDYYLKYPRLLQERTKEWKKALREIEESGNQVSVAQVNWMKRSLQIVCHEYDDIAEIFIFLNRQEHDDDD